MSSMLSIGFSGLTAAQVALNVASNNIANVNTIGYSRQDVLISSRFGTSGLANGAGVGVDSVRRMTDSYLNTQLWNCSSTRGFYTSQVQYLNTTEQMFGSDSLSITLGLDNFYTALNAAAESPESQAPRQQIISSASALASRFNQLSKNLNSQEIQLNDQMSSTVSQINLYTDQVAKLNQQIQELGASGGNTAQLEDQRDLAIRNLSELVDVQVNRQSDGSISLNLSHGQPLVMGNSASTLELKGSSLSVQFGTQTFPVTQALQGSLGGLMDYHANVLVPSRTELNQIAAQFADELNALQGQGFDLNDPATLGKPLFSYDPADPAGSLKVSADFRPEDLAFRGATTDEDGNLVPDGGPGDNRNLQAMVETQGNHYDAYSSLLGHLAVVSGQAQADLASSEQIEAQIESKVSSVSGVNLDEETINIMQYAQAYQANAKVISTADQLFNTVLGLF